MEVPVSPSHPISGVELMGGESALVLLVTRPRLRVPSGSGGVMAARSLSALALILVALLCLSL